LKKLFPAFSLFCAVLSAGEYNASLEGYLSEQKEQQFMLERRKIDAQSATLRDSWIQPIRLRYSYTKSDPYDSGQTTKNAAVTIDQPIFKSGGIYYGIKYAEASRRNAGDTVEQQRRALIRETVALLMQIRQSDLRIEQQELVIANAKINLEQKRELYLNGQIDSGFLNSAMIEANTAIQALYDLQTARERLVSLFHTLSDLDPETARIPILSLIGEEEFFTRNIDLSRMQSEVRMQRYNESVTFAKYLPQLNVVAGYNRDENDKVVFAEGFAPISSETEYYNYGLKFTMALDINSISDVEAAQVAHLKSQIVLDDTKRELRALYEQVSQNLENYDRKIALAVSNQELYGELLQETKELYRAGYKTEFDVQNLENSVAIQKLDTRIYELDKQRELLNLYEKVAPEAR
jgi:outer membrane protein TolC